MKHSSHVSKQNKASANQEASGGHGGIKCGSSTGDNNICQNDLSDDTRSLGVTVHAVQDQMPGGMQTVLNIFSNVIQQQSALIQQVISQEIAEQAKELQNFAAKSASADK